MTLTLVDAQRLAVGAITEARKYDARISVTVCDADGRLITLSRMDGAGAEVNRGSIGKAIAAASFGLPSDARDPADDFPLRTATVVGEGLPIDHRRGGLPIIRNGKVEGGCGIDGSSTSEQDELCARAGLAAMAPGQGEG